jgi:hypothetical protein
MTRKQFQNVAAPDPGLLVALDAAKKQPSGSGKFAKTEKGAIEQQPNEGQANTCPPRPVAGPDLEVWVRDQVRTAMRMGLAIAAAQWVRADETALRAGMDGIADGAAIEILATCGYDTKQLVNLRR